MGQTMQPERILQELDELWASLAKPPENEQAGGVMRACSLTLIAVTEGSSESSAISRTIAELMHEHPCRAILLFVRPSEERLLDARVTAQCWMPFGQHEQICCEQIEVTAAERDLPSLPNFLLPLTAPDLPVAIWFHASRLAAAPAFEQFARRADTFIVDSVQLGGLREFRRLQARLGSRVADLAWTRLTRWREIIAQVFENPSARASLGRFSEVAISAGHTQGLPYSPEVHYLAAWLARGLDFKWDGQAFRSADGKASLLLRPEPGGEPGVRGIALAAPDLNISVKLTEQSVVEVWVNRVNRSTAFPSSTDCSLLREELSITDGDPVFEETVKLAELLAQQGSHQ